MGETARFITDSIRETLLIEHLFHFVVGLP
jgi:hypothetical protein